VFYIDEIDTCSVPKDITGVTLKDGGDDDHVVFPCQLMKNKWKVYLNNVTKL